MAGTRWRVDDTIAFSGTATDFPDADPRDGLTWNVNLRHCDRFDPDLVPHAPAPDVRPASRGCSRRPITRYPAYLEIELTAHGTGGLTATTTRRLDPRTVEAHARSRPAGAGDSRPAA